MCKDLLRSSRIWLVLLLGAVIGCGSPSFAGRQVYWGVFMDGVPWSMSKLAAFEQEVGKAVSIVHWGQPWWHCYDECGYQSFNSQRAQYDAVRQHGAIPLVDWASWDWAAKPVATQPKFTLSSIIDGKHDVYIREWATQAKEWGHPFFLRFNWEMNGHWYPWSEVQNGNRKGEFVSAWKHVHDLFREVGATNVTWVWCVSNLYKGSQAFADVYPGDAYVDWLGVDGYNWSDHLNVPWRSFYELFRPSYDSLVRVSNTKPIVIAEIASTENFSSADPDLSKAQWIHEAFSPDTLADMSQLRAIVWFNWDDGKDLSWPLDTSKAATAAFRESIASPLFVGNVFAALHAAPIPPPEVPAAVAGQ